MAITMTELLDSKAVVSIGSAIIGIFATWVTQQILNKRGIISYTVEHNRVGISADDAIFGSVKLTYNGDPVPNLYLSVIEIKNESNKDYENLEIRAHSTDTKLLSQQTQYDNTTYELQLTDRYKKQFEHLPDNKPTEEQVQLFGSQREFAVPVLNRGQKLKLTFLNSAISSSSPNIWVDIIKKGVNVVYRKRPPNLFMGESQNRCGFIGFIMGCLVMAIIIANDTVLWLAVVSSFLYGITVLLPGALFLKGWRKVRRFLGD